LFIHVESSIKQGNWAMSRKGRSMEFGLFQDLLSTNVGGVGAGVFHYFYIAVHS